VSTAFLFVFYNNKIVNCVLRDVVHSFYHGVLYIKSEVLQVKHVVLFTIVRKVQLSMYILLRKSHTPYNTVCTYVIHIFIQIEQTCGKGG
jgi:hypothetical protein